MKIGFFTDSYLPSHDGVATTVESCARELQRLGHEVVIIAPAQPHKKERKAVHRIISIRTLKEPEIWVGLEVPQPELFKIAKIEFDIIHGHSGGPISLLGYQLAKLHNIPFIETYHTLWKYYTHYFPFHLANPWLLRVVSKYWGNDCDAMIVPTSKIKRELVRYGIRKPIYIVPNGIKLDRFGHSQKGYLRNKLQISPDKKILVTVGRLEKEKSIDFVIRSFAASYKHDKNFILCIVGEGREKHKLERLVTSYKLQHAVFFLGAVPFSEMPDVYADTDLFVFGSTTETQGMVVIEALASGVPVVAVYDTAIADSVLTNSNGILVHKDKEVFGQTIYNILHNKDLYIKLQKQTQPSVTRFSIQMTTQVLLQVYDEVLFTRSYSPIKASVHFESLFSSLRVPTSVRKLSSEYASIKALLEEHISRKE
jgi:1,2-diacylglycerol 3-alpha-glucosyltransferase